MTETTKPFDQAYYDIVAARVRGVWAATGRSRADLAVLLEVHIETARAKFRGDRPYTLDDLRLIARAVGVTVGDLADDDDIPTE